MQAVKSSVPWRLAGKAARLVGASANRTGSTGTYVGLPYRIVSFFFRLYVASPTARLAREWQVSSLEDHQSHSSRRRRGAAVG